MNLGLALEEFRRDHVNSSQSGSSMAGKNCTPHHISAPLFLLFRYYPADEIILGGAASGAASAGQIIPIETRRQVSLTIAGMFKLCVLTQKGLSMLLCVPL